MCILQEIGNFVEQYLTFLQRAIRALVNEQALKSFTYLLFSFLMHQADDKCIYSSCIFEPDESRL